MRALATFLPYLTRIAADPPVPMRADQMYIIKDAEKLNQLYNALVASVRSADINVRTEGATRLSSIVTGVERDQLVARCNVDLDAGTHDFPWPFTATL